MRARSNQSEDDRYVAHFDRCQMIFHCSDISSQLKLMNIGETIKFLLKFIIYINDRIRNADQSFKESIGFMVGDNHYYYDANLAGNKIAALFPTIKTNSINQDVHWQLLEMISNAINTINASNNMQGRFLENLKNSITIFYKINTKERVPSLKSENTQEIAALIQSCCRHDTILLDMTSIYDKHRELLSYMEKEICATNWVVGEFGGKKIKLDDRCITVPDHVERVYSHCIKANEDHRWEYHFQKIANIFSSAQKKPKTTFFGLAVRDELTQRFYSYHQKLFNIDKQASSPEPQNLRM